MKKVKLLVSACLAGENVRYDGKNSMICEFDKLKDTFDLEYICPEVASGMTIPRDSNEIISQNPLKIESKLGISNEKYFMKGSSIALSLCNKLNIKYALLKSKSPSCGNEKIYDGNFNGTLIDGMGVTAKMLKNNGIIVFNENQIKSLYKAANNK